MLHINLICCSYHVVLLERAVRGTLMQDSEWYHLLQPEHSIQCVFIAALPSSKREYTGTSSTDFTADSVVRISFLYDLPFLETAPQMHGDTFSLEQSDIDLGAL